MTHTVYLKILKDFCFIMFTCYLPRVNTLGTLVHECTNHKLLELVLLFIHFILFFEKLMYMYTWFKELQIFLEKSISFL